MPSIQSSMIRFLLRRWNIWDKPLDEIRNSMEKMKAKKYSENVSISKEIINGVSCQTFTGKNAQCDTGILYFHGGGFCLGIYDTNRQFVAGIAERCGLKVYMPDYRLAPENPFPASLEDGIAVYRELVKNLKKLIIMGDSSGCALALSTLNSISEASGKQPAALIFITPVLDLAGKGETLKTKAKCDPFKNKDPLGIAKIYVKDNNPASPLISPIYDDLGNLPPVLVHGAEYDVFLSDSLRLTEKIKEAGGKAELRIFNKMWHIFHMQAPFVPESEKAVNEMCSYIKGI